MINKHIIPITHREVNHKSINQLIPRAILILKMRQPLSFHFLLYTRSLWRVQIRIFGLLREHLQSQSICPQIFHVVDCVSTSPSVTRLILASTSWPSTMSRFRPLRSSTMFSLTCASHTQSGISSHWLTSLDQLLQDHRPAEVQPLKPSYKTANSQSP
jgi:hypothetical protein